MLSLEQSVNSNSILLQILSQLSLTVPTTTVTAVLFVTAVSPVITVSCDR